VTALVLGAVATLLVADVSLRLPHGRPRPARRPVSASTRRAAVGVAALGVGVIAPPVLAVSVVAWWGVPLVQARRRDRAHQRAVRHALPDLVDLLRLATTAGLSLPIALPVVARHAPSPVALALESAHASASLGRPRADALVEALAPLGDRAHALAHVLGDHLRYGVPLLPGLERTGLELRLERRRAAELEARRVPVRLLAPLVTCVLPAFALLTVIPLLVPSLESLPL